MANRLIENGGGEAAHLEETAWRRRNALALESSGEEKTLA